MEIYPEEMREEWIEDLQRQSRPERSSRSGSRSRSRSRSTGSGDGDGDGTTGETHEMRTVMVDQRTSRTRIMGEMLPRGRGMIPGRMMPGKGRAGPSDPTAAAAAAAAAEATREPRAPTFRSPDLRPDLSADQGLRQWIDCRKLEMTLSDVLKMIRKEGCRWVSTSRDRSYAMIDEIGVDWLVWENGYFKQRSRL